MPPRPALIDWNPRPLTRIVVADVALTSFWLTPTDEAAWARAWDTATARTLRISATAAATGRAIRLRTRMPAPLHASSQRRARAHGRHVPGRRADARRVQSRPPRARTPRRAVQQ